MPDIKKFLDGEGLKFLWQKISMEDYPNNDTLIAVINAIDENKQDKITGTEKQVTGFDINGKLIAKDLDETLSQVGVPADAAATGAAVAPIAAITETTTTNEITWDGVVGDRLVYHIEEFGADMVHMSDYAPEMSVFTQEGFSIRAVIGRDSEELDYTIPPETASTYVAPITESLYMVFELCCIVALEDGASYEEEDATLCFPKKGIYFMYVPENGNHTISISSPLMEVPTTKVKKEALPDDIGGELPDVTTTDAGKFLRVSSEGVWAAETISNAEEASF